MYLMIITKIEKEVKSAAKKGNNRLQTKE